MLAGVGLLRALSHIGPPLLDGLGRPDLSARYQFLAATLLSGCFFGFAYAFGDSMGYASVALAWAVGYPIAFAVLMLMVFKVSGMKLANYILRVGKIPIAIAIAFGAALVVHLALHDQPAGLRLGAVAGTLAAVEFFTLTRIAGVRLLSAKP